MHFFALLRIAAPMLAFGTSVLVSVGGLSEAVLLSLNGKGKSADLLVYHFIAATYTLAALAALHGLVFWLGALLG